MATKIDRMRFIAFSFLILNLLMPKGASGERLLATQKTVNNADESVIGPTLSQKHTQWCFAYVAADLVSQKLGVRVSPIQIAINSGAKTASDFATISDSGGFSSEAIKSTNVIGFCHMQDRMSLRVQHWLENPTFRMGSQILTLVNRCEEKIQLDVSEDQIHRLNASPLELIEKTDELLESGHLVGLSLTLDYGENVRHAVTLTGKICDQKLIQDAIQSNPDDFPSRFEYSRPFDDCIYSIRNSANLKNHFLTKRFILTNSNRIYWID